MLHKANRFGPQSPIYTRRHDAPHVTPLVKSLGGKFLHLLPHRASPGKREDECCQSFSCIGCSSLARYMDVVSTGQ